MQILHLHCVVEEECYKTPYADKKTHFVDRSTDDQRPIAPVKEKESTHVADVALMVAMHTSINVVDHITRTIKTTCPHSIVANTMQLGRTKCSAIIKNVWGPYFRKDLRDDVDRFYSVLIDESTDKSTLKQLGVVLKYFSKRQQQISKTRTDSEWRCIVHNNRAEKSTGRIRSRSSAVFR